MSALAKIPETAVQPDVESGLRFLKKSVARELATLPERDDIVRECLAVVNAEAPASPQSFAVTLERLALHYPENRLTPAEQKLLLKDWRRLMGHLPSDILAAAADTYIMSAQRFFPTPGQLNTVAERLWQMRKLLAKRARETLDLIEAGRKAA